MNTMRILGKRGDTPIGWDPANAESVETARQAFNALKAQGLLAFDAPPGKDAVEINTFDPNAGEILFTRPIAGG